MESESMPVPKPKHILNFLQVFPGNIRTAIVTGILSLAAGLSAVAFLFLTNLLFSKTYLVFAAHSRVYFIVASFLVITLTSAMVGLLLNVFSPEAAGSGIPQVKSAYWKELGHLKIKPVLIKFLAGILSIGGGNSLGREGPSVFIGSGVASNMDGVFGTPLRGRRAAAVIGASAGLAAAFNAPLAAITFVIEEIVGDLNNRYLGRVVLSSVIGAFVVYALLGRQPAFSSPPHRERILASLSHCPTGRIYRFAGGRTVSACHSPLEAANEKTETRSRLVAPHFGRFGDLDHRLWSIPGHREDRRVRTGLSGSFQRPEQ